MILATSGMMAQETVVSAGNWQLTANETTGKVTIAYGDEILISGNEAEWGLNNTKTTFTSLTDIEIYNCAKLTRLPIELLCGLPNMQAQINVIYWKRRSLDIAHCSRRWISCGTRLM